MRFCPFPQLNLTGEGKRERENSEWLTHQKTLASRRRNVWVPVFFLSLQLTNKTHLARIGNP